MGFERIGLVSDYTRQAQMFSKWKRKKESRSYRIDENASASEKWRQRKVAQDQQLMEALNKQDEGKDTLLADIHNKLATGQKLTPEERAYLKEKDPMAYQRLEEEELEKKRYETELKQSKTKEEAQRVETNHAMASLAKVKAVDSNPNIPDAQKIAIFWSENQKAKDRAEVMQKFVASGEYGKLPTEAEVQKAREDLREAERQEQLERQEERKQQREEAEAEALAETETGIETAESAKTESPASLEGNAGEDKVSQDPAPQENKASAEIPDGTGRGKQGGESQGGISRHESTQGQKTWSGKAKDSLEHKERLAKEGEKPISRMDAEYSREALKVKRSKLNKLKHKFIDIGNEASAPHYLSASGGKGSAGTPSGILA